MHHSQHNEGKSCLLHADCPHGKAATHKRTVCMGLLLFLELAAKASSAAPMDPSVMAMCSQDRNVRSLARNVLGSSRCTRAGSGRVSAVLSQPGAWRACARSLQHSCH